MSFRRPVFGFLLAFIAPVAAALACWLLAGAAYAVGTADGFVSVGTTTNPTSEFGVYGGATIGSGYNGTLAPTNGLLVQGNVGVGTTSPSDANGANALQVKGATGTDIINATDGSSSGAIYIHHGATGGVSPVQFGSISNDNLGFFTNNSAPQMTLAVGGNVGIGTTNPASGNLVINAASGGQELYVTSSTMNSVYQYINNTGARLYLGNDNSAGTGLWTTGGLAYASSMGTGNSTAFQLATNNNVRMTIDPSGNVGIGTTSPQSKLHIQSGEVQVGSSGASCAAANQGAIRYNGGVLYYCDNVNVWESVDSSGAVDTGDYYIATQTATPTSGQGMFGGSATLGGVHAGYGSTADVTLENRSLTPALEVLANSTNIYVPGNVGIGTTSPASTLDVSGNMHVSGYYNGPLSALTGTYVLGSWGNNATGFSGNNDANSAYLQDIDGIAYAVNSGGIVQYPGVRFGLQKEGTWNIADGGTVAGSFVIYTSSGGSGVSLPTLSEKFRVTSIGNVGIGTTTPIATLDVNGYAHLAKNTSQPVACDAAHDGSLALASTRRPCECVTSAWIDVVYGTACSW